MRRRISDLEKSEIVDLHLRGLSRDEIAKKTKVSAGGVSSVIREFTDCADSSSVDEAAEEYGVLDTVESLRSLAVEIRKSGTSIEELLGLSNMLGRIKKLITLDKLEEFIKAGESLKDRVHVEASVKMHAIEERTGRSYDDILNDLQSKETKVKELSAEIQRLQSQIKNLESEREKAQAGLNAEKAKLNAELEERLKQHNLTLERMEHISRVERALNGYGIDLAQLEGLQRVLNAVDEAGQDAKRLVELAKKVVSLKAQAETEAKELAEIRELVAKLSETISTLEKKLTSAEIIIERCRELESMGWSLESLEKAVRLARQVGTPEEVLNRLELLKPSAEVKAELEKVKAEIETLNQETLKTIRGTLKTLSTLADESSVLVNEKIPGIVAELSNVVKTQIIDLENEYNSLAEKYSGLQADFGKLDEEYRKHQKMLDDAMSWTMLLFEPQKLPGDTIGRIFFDVMFPRLETWGKSKSAKERSDIAGELAKRAICLYTEPTANFLKAPEKASVADAMLALISFAVAIMPFYATFMEWYARHKHEEGASKLFNAYYHLKQFCDEGIRSF